MGSQTSSYFPQSNGRAEVAVKITKRLLEGNMGPAPGGSIDKDKAVRGLLQLRKYPRKGVFNVVAEKKKSRHLGRLAGGGILGEK